MLGRDNCDCPQTSALPTQIDMKHCLTNSNHQHVGAKRSVLWPSKYAKMHFRLWLCLGLCGAHNAPAGSLVGWVGDTSPYSTSLGVLLDSPTFGSHHLAPQFGGGGDIAWKYLFLALPLLLVICRITSFKNRVLGCNYPFTITQGHSVTLPTTHASENYSKHISDSRP